jgi:hypothetical protein
MASGHVQNVEVFCAAFPFSPIRAGDGIASDDHPVHSSTNDIEWGAMNGGKRKKEAFMPADQAAA